MASTQRHLQGNGGLYVGSASITISALSAGTEEDLSITDSNVAASDVICASIINAGMETGVGVVAAWCSTAGTFKVRISNFSGSGLTGGATTLYYMIIKTA